MALQSAVAKLLAPLRRHGGEGGRPSDGQLLAEFEQGRVEEAFAELVRRHGPMVLGVCRRLIGDAHLAEDAFQAVFLVLARRAAEVRPREQVGGWLHGTARRTALRARALRWQQNARELSMNALPDVMAPDPSPPDDTAAVLDEEIAALPEHLRLAIILCDLEGRPQREVAKQLGVAVSSLAGRLGTARKRLADRLTKRGVTLGTATVTAGISTGAAASLAKAAVQAAAGASLVGLVPALTIQLSEGVLRMILLTKLKSTAVALAAAVLLAGGLGATSLPILLAQETPKPAAAKPQLGPNLSDEEFLKRVCLDLRGTPATTPEVGYFVPDADPVKRKKVVDWLTAPPMAVTILGPGTGSRAQAGVVPVTRTVMVPKLFAKMPDYTIEAPDILEIVVYQKQAEGKQTVRTRQCPVSPDGTIDLGLSGGRVKVQNMTVGEAMIAVGRAVNRQAPEGSETQVRLDVIAYNSKFAYFIADDTLGVEQVTRLPITGNETVLDLIAAAKPLSLRGHNVWLTRQKPSGGDDILPVDLVGITNHGVTKTNYQLMPGDRLYLKAKSPPKVAASALGEDVHSLEKALGTVGCTNCHSPAPPDFAGLVDDLRSWGNLLGRETDETFLDRVCQEARGMPATRVEREYFTADKSDGKKAKFLDLLLKDPAISKKVGAGWKEKALNPKPAGTQLSAYCLQDVHAPLNTLLDQLLDGKRSSESVLELLMVATHGRLPTDSERQLILGTVKSAKEPKVAWRLVVQALANSDGARKWTR